MPVNATLWKGLPAGQLTVVPGSGGLKCAERITFTQVLGGRYADAVTYALNHPRGSEWYLSLAGGFGGRFFVEDASVESAKGSKGTVTVNYVYLGVVPPEEFALTPFEINPAIERNTFFNALTKPDLQKARSSFTAATSKGQTSLDYVITGIANTTLVSKLIEKWMRGEENFYLFGYTFSHTIYFTSPPAATEGGFIQNPFGSFAGYTALSGFSWLRKGDEVAWQNGLWKVTRTWLGGPSGNWDTDLYPAL